MERFKESTIQINNDFEIMDRMLEHEQVIFCSDPSTGLRAIIAIHDTTLGPALGGCRMKLYETFDDALDDALRLSKAMTYKCAASNVDFGGGKAVIIGDPMKDKTPELFRSFGQFIESLGGRFYTGTDMGTTMDDFIHASRETSNIVGIPEEYGGGGDSSYPTSMGVIYGIKATNKILFGTEDIRGVTYAVQGLGKVGFKVAESLLNEGADVYVSDLDSNNILALQEKAKTALGSVKSVESNDIYSQEADIFVPCAAGGVINDETIQQLKVKAVAGSANNQLQADEHGDKLAELGILYAPDYIINFGGLIQVADELYGFNKNRVLRKTKEIYHTLLKVYQLAELNQISTVKAANQMCEQIISDRQKRNSFYTRSMKPKWDIR
ncbi:Glu/Leu/Phe/Val dehydrogenase [Oceanobacillus sp. J11TS1]|uniref:Leu/Phe/Val dehydrogenase n=1 Tax=Oceanobacillus sp. J11TS1 TaxID=2807191 RepID=UPI001B2409D8|nr:Glu/Leu/Phe/Val dehydrogenase [Oceanobacillus sp. J11TS1]GIO23648.1 leucine dehydrogenase [Oceanobacillus sp. J11TS1]